MTPAASVASKTRSAIESERYRELGLRVSLWLANGRWSRSGDRVARARRDRPAADFAVEVLARRRRKIGKKVKRVAEMAPRQRHKLRIEVKKLRYGSGFFATYSALKSRSGAAKPSIKP